MVGSAAPLYTSEWFAQSLATSESRHSMNEQVEKEQPEQLTELWKEGLARVHKARAAQAQAEWIQDFAARLSTGVIVPKGKAA